MRGGGQPGRISLRPPVLRRTRAELLPLASPRPCAARQAPRPTGWEEPWATRLARDRPQLRVGVCPSAHDASALPSVRGHVWDAILLL